MDQAERLKKPHREGAHEGAPNSMQALGMLIFLREALSGFSCVTTV